MGGRCHGLKFTLRSRSGIMPRGRRCGWNWSICRSWAGGLSACGSTGGGRRRFPWAANPRCWRRCASGGWRIEGKFQVFSFKLSAGAGTGDAPCAATPPAVGVGLLFSKLRQGRHIPLLTELKIFSASPSTRMSRLRRCRLTAQSRSRGRRRKVGTPLRRRPVGTERRPHHRSVHILDTFPILRHFGAAKPQKASELAIKCLSWRT